MSEVLIDQTIKYNQTNWFGGSTYQGQLFSPTVGEIWIVTEISGYGDNDDWDAYNAYCHIGICKSFSDWNPNNGLQFGSTNSCTSVGLKHSFDMTTVSGYPNGLYLFSDWLYYFYFRIVAGGFSGKCEGSQNYDRHANTTSIDSSNGGGTWNKPNTWGAPDLRFEMVGTKVESGGGVSNLMYPTWSF